MRWALRILALCAVPLILSACGGDGRPRVLVAAASDLRFAFEAMEPGFEDRCTCDLVFSFGSSGTLATQIGQGLKADVFASADAGYVDQMERQGLLLADTRRLYAIGRIVIAVPAGSGHTAASLDDLREPAFGKVSIANPEHAPYGRAAKEALTAAGVWQDVESRLVLGENALLATQFVETANADAGIVPLSLAIQRERFLRYVLIPDSLHKPLRQEAAVLGSSRQAQLATSFLDYIAGEGRALMRSYGFLLPGESHQQ